MLRPGDDRPSSPEPDPAPVRGSLTAFRPGAALGGLMQVTDLPLPGVRRRLGPYLGPAGTPYARRECPWPFCVFCHPWVASGLAARAPSTRWVLGWRGWAPVFRRTRPDSPHPWTFKILAFPLFGKVRSGSVTGHRRSLRAGFRPQATNGDDDHETAKLRPGGRRRPRHMSSHVGSGRTALHCFAVHFLWP